MNVAFFMCRVAVAILAGLTLQGSGLVLRSPSKDGKDGKASPIIDTVARFESMDEQLHSCLNGKRIVFIGPSTSKLDYLALAFFAEYGRWPTEDTVYFGEPGKWAGSGPNPLYGPVLEYGMKIEGQEPPQPVSPCKAGSTETYMRYSNHILNGHEVCDCYKEGGWTGATDTYNSTENRVYDNGKTMLAYFQWFGDVVDPRGTFSFWPMQQIPPKPVEQTCPAGQFKGSWDWSMSLQQFISTSVVHFRPTHLVLDAAFWPIDAFDTPFWEQVAQAGVAAVMSSQGKVIWRTTPKRRDTPIVEHSGAVDMTGLVSRGWQVYDARNMVRGYQGTQDDDKIFIDNTHLTPKAQCHISKTFIEQLVCPLH